MFLHGLPTYSTPRAVVKYVRYTSPPPRMTALSSKLSPS
jgi:hypothetical protein